MKEESKQQFLIDYKNKVEIDLNVKNSYTLLLHEILTVINKSLADNIHKDSALHLYRGNIVAPKFENEINPRVVGLTLFVEFRATNTLAITKLFNPTEREYDAMMLMKSEYLYKDFKDSLNLDVTLSLLYNTMIKRIVADSFVTITNNIFNSLNEAEKEYKARKAEQPLLVEDCINKEEVKEIGESSDKETLKEYKSTMTIVK